MRVWLGAPPRATRILQYCFRYCPEPHTAKSPRYGTPALAGCEPRACTMSLDRRKMPRQSGAFAALGGLGLLIDGGLGDIGQRFVRRLLFLKGLLQK